MNPKQEAVRVALRRMFSEKRFSICTIDSCLKVTGSIPDPEVYKILSAIHCVSFEEMTQEFRDWLYGTVLQMFSENGFDLSLLDAPKRPMPQQQITIREREKTPNKLMKLLGR